MTKNQKNYGDAKINKLKNSEVEIIGSIPSEIWERHRGTAVENINNSVSVDGFRKGMVPENILIKRVGEMAVLEEMAELALSPAYMDIIIDNKIDAIGRPKIEVTKLASGNPLEFKITSAVFPDIVLPDYKQISADIVAKQNPEDVKVTEKDMESTIGSILSDAQRTDDKGVSSDAGQSKSDVKPELTDEFVKKLGAFSSVSDFKEKLKTMLEQQKRDQAIEKRRIQIADAISDATKIEIPEIMIESETARIESQFNHDIEKMGVKLEDYLKHSKKSIEDLRGEWRPHAEKKAKLQLILNAISAKEKLRPAEEEVEHEVKHIMGHYKDADHEQAHTYADTVLTNEKVFRFLEENK